MPAKFYVDLEWPDRKAHTGISATRLPSPAWKSFPTQAAAMRALAVFAKRWANVRDLPRTFRIKWKITKQQFTRHVMSAGVVKIEETRRR